MTSTPSDTIRLQAEVETLKQLLDVHEQQVFIYLETIKRQQKEIEARSREVAGVNAKLRETTSFLEEIYRTMPCALMVIDRNGLIVASNQGALELLEYTEAELIGAPISKVLASGDLLDFVQIEMLADKGAVLRTEKECLTKAGKSIPVLFSAGVIAGGEGAVRTNYGVVSIVLDIRDRKRLEIELRQAQKLESIGQLAAGIAHEINTPTQYIGDNTRFLSDAFEELTPVLSGCVELAAAGESADAVIPPEMLESMRRADIGYLLEEIPKAIKQSLEGVERVTKIVRSMKEFSHPGTVTKRAIDLNHAIETTLTVAQNEWKYVAELQLDLTPDLPPVVCLPDELNQVLLNMIVNAAHAMEAKLGTSPQQNGTLTVRTRRDGDEVAIQIQDTGAGIPPNIRDRIYDPFFTTKEVGRGTGQGLAIAHSVVVDRHGGTISFETEMGQGTTFTICLPIQPPSTDDNNDSSAQAQP